MNDEKKTEVEIDIKHIQNKTGAVFKNIYYCNRHVTYTLVCVPLVVTCAPGQHRKERVVQEVQNPCHNCHPVPRDRQRYNEL